VKIIATMEETRQIAAALSKWEKNLNPTHSGRTKKKEPEGTKNPDYAP